MFDNIKWRAKRLWGRIRFGRWVRIFGPFTIVNRRNVTIGHEVAFNSGVYILGRVGIHIGNRVVLSANCMLIDSGLDPNHRAADGLREHVDSPITIEDGVWIGAGAIVLAGVTIGHDSIIGAGSVVTHDIPPLVLAAGNPAQVIRSLS